MNFYSQDSAYSNFRSLELNFLNFTSKKGLFQVTSFKTKSANSSFITLDIGNVILQSTNEIKISFKNEIQAFCFAAPNYTVSSITGCYYDSKFFFFFSVIFKYII